MATEFKLDLSKLKNIKLTQQQQQYVVMAVIAVGGAVYGYWNYLIKPMNEEIKTLSKTFSEKKEDLKQAKEFEANWMLYEQRLAKTQEGIRYVARRFPRKEHQTVDFTKLLTMTQARGLELTGYTAKKVKGKEKNEFEGFEKTVVAIIVVTDFHGVGRFFSLLSGEDILYLVEEVSLKAIPTNELKQTVTAEFNLSTYVAVTKKS